MPELGPNGQKSIITNNNQHVKATGGGRGHAPIEKGCHPPLNHHCGANEACHHRRMPVMMPELGPMAKNQ